MQERQQQRSGRIHYRTIWRGDRTVMFVHGWMVSSRVWNRLLPLFPDSRLIVPDLCGSGASRNGSSTVTLDDHVNDLAALCDGRGFRDIHLVGHSMGGQVAALLAARQPHRFASLTLLNPVPVQGLPLPDDLAGLFRSSGGNPEALGRILDMACLALDPEARDELLADALEIAPDTIRSGFEAWSAGQPSASLADATMPANVIATDDPFLPAGFLRDTVVAKLPNARLHHLPGAGHYPQIEAPLATATLLQELLA